MAKGFKTNPLTGDDIVLGHGDATATAWGTQKFSEDYSLFRSMFTFDVPPRLNGVKKYNLKIYYER